MNKIKEYQEIINSKIKQVRIQGKPDELYNPINYILSLKKINHQGLYVLNGKDVFQKNLEIYFP